MRQQSRLLTGAGPSKVAARRYRPVRGLSAVSLRHIPMMIILAFTLARTAAGTEARQDDVFFQTPTGNISCMIVSEQDGYVRCDMQQLQPSHATPPDDCDLDWGTAFAITANGKSGELICHGDTLFGTRPMKLEYGKTLEVGGFRCLSEKTGLTCKNSAGHGFMLSRARQRLF